MAFAVFRGTSIIASRAAAVPLTICARPCVQGYQFGSGASLFVQTPTFGTRACRISHIATFTMSAATTLTELPKVKTIDGTELPASTFAGKLTLAVNVASACGYTNSGYKTMKELGEMFPDDLVVVAIPCNQFGKQENGTPDEIKAFAKGKYSKLVITERSDVNGTNVHPIMAIGKEKFPGNVKWNFDARFLFDKNGKPVARFDNSAGTAQIKAEIQKYL